MGSFWQTAISIFGTRAPAAPAPGADQEAPGQPELEEVRRLMAAGRTSQAMALLAQLKGRRLPTRSVDYLRALCLMRRDQSADAIEAVKEELRYFPENAEAAALLRQLTANQAKPPLPADAEFHELFTMVAPYTMLSPERLFSLYTLTKGICLRDLPGQFVECGVAAGGSSALLAAVAARHSRRPRRVFACDSFEGLPAPGALDRHEDQPAAALGWSGGTCAAPIESLLAVCRKLGVEPLVEPVRGFFAQTLPAMRERIGPIAFLHIDGDWYDSTRDVLTNLFDAVVEGGRIQIDDYGYWEGCRRAVEDFQKESGLRFQFQVIDSTGVWVEKARMSASQQP